MQKIRKMRKSDEGVVGVIVAILLIGLLLSVISIIQLVFIPNWMEKIEAEHMDKVSEQFAQLKFAVDIQSTLQRENLPVSVPITLGSREFPLLQSSKSFGSLEIIDDACRVRIRYNGGIHYDEYVLGGLRFSSSNSYYIDQSYIYECGAIITDQDQGNMMVIKPGFSATIENNTLHFVF